MPELPALNAGHGTFTAGWYAERSGRGATRRVMSDPLTDELAGYRDVFRENRAVATELCLSLTVPAFNWRPAGGGWSVAECLEHLNISGQLFGEAILLAAARGRAAAVTGSGPFTYGFVTRVVLKGVHPESKTRYRAPKRFVPRPITDYDPDRSLGAFALTGERWERCLTAANGLDLARIKVPSPALKLMRFNLGGLLAIQTMHERRHLEQARRVTLQDGFTTG